jgi:hypothetical protein
VKNEYKNTLFPGNWNDIVATRMIPPYKFHFFARSWPLGYFFVRKGIILSVDLTEFFFLPTDLVLASFKPGFDEAYPLRIGTLTNLNSPDLSLF